MTTRPGSETNPFRVCIIGSGPSAFYAADALFKLPGLHVRVDMFDRLPVPYGLVRGGVAPDHQNIKSVVKVYQKTAEQEGFRFFGNVKLGRDLQVPDLAAHYHQIVYAVGAETDNKLGIPGEDLGGVHSATEFVGWYNGHPDYRNRHFDLASATRVAIVGNGNVAMDVSRILLADPADLAKTDLADYALEELRRSRVRDVILLGRRGPAQAAFSPKEIEEIAAIPIVDVVVSKAEATLDPLSAAWLEKEAARSAHRNVKFLLEASARGEGTRAKKLHCRFLVAPVEIQGEKGVVKAVTVQHAVLEADSSGTPRPKSIDRFETQPIDLLFKSIGYRGVPIPGVPFDEKKGIIPNAEGRVLDRAGGTPVPGTYVVGWAKRGPTGLIGTNSPDSKATVEAMKQDLDTSKILAAGKSDIAELLLARKIDAVSWQDWQRLDAFEAKGGEKKGKVRDKLTVVDEMMRVVRELRCR